MGLDTRDMSFIFGSLDLLPGNLPAQLPSIVPKSIVTPHQMSEGEDGPGLRIFRLGGVHISNTDLDIVFYALTSVQVALFLADYRAQRTVKVMRWTDNVSAETKEYRWIYQEEGCLPELQPRENYHDPREVWKCSCKIHILEQVL